jgi:3-oxoacyl-[acyl-carrier-protein] synthase-3
MLFSKITGVGHYVPERVVTNQELEQYMSTTDAWIRNGPASRNAAISNPVPIR